MGGKVQRLPAHLQPGKAIDDRIEPLSLAVVGVRHANRDKSKSNRRFEIRVSAPGEPIELRPEPRNPVDPRAVAVFSARGVQIGYLTAERCGRIGAIIRQGREVTAAFQAESDFGAWIRVAFDGEQPELPLPRETSEPVAEADIEPPPEQDFWPDEEWPD